MTSEKTITVNGYNGDKQMTKEQFVQVWTENCEPLIHLVETGEDKALVTEITNNTKALAGQLPN